MRTLRKNSWRGSRVGKRMVEGHGERRTRCRASFGGRSLRVRSSLLGLAKDERDRQPSASRRPASSSDRRSGSKKRRPRLTASEYVVKMDIAEDRRQWLTEVAGQFDAKSFLPTSGMCGGSAACTESLHRVRWPAAVRSEGVQVLGTMDRDEVSEMLDSGLFSGPAQLGPIADAIRETGRERRSVPWTRLRCRCGPPPNEDDRCSLRCEYASESHASGSITRAWPCGRERP